MAEPFDSQERMSQLFQPRADAIFRFVLWCAVLGAGAGLITVESLAHSDWLTGRGIVEEQPTEFSHQHHAGELGIDCRYCHTTVETAATAGMPPTYTCMTCHSQIWTGARMLKIVRDSLANGTPLVWTRAGRYPQYVYFDHSVHVDNGIGCSSCHGDMEHMQMTYQPHAFSMDFCVNCHRHPDQFIRPKNEIFDMQWAPSENQATLGRELLTKYHIESTQLLTSCSTCHR